MSIIEKAKFAWDSKGVVNKLIDEWNPGKLKTEQQYEKSLYDHLHDNFGTIQVTKQYAKGRVRADIVVGDTVIIEIKNNLDSTGKYQRLIGQLAEYKGWEGSIIILLCGKTDVNLGKQLAKYLKDEGLDDDVFGPGALIIAK
jgi:hypothetical protein